MTTPADAFLVSTGSALPARVVANVELAAAFGIDARTISTTSGIGERRYAGPGESVVDLAVAAAANCLGSAPPSVDLLLMASGTAAQRFPGPATEVARRLGLEQVPAIDLPLPSTGGLVGLALARTLCRHYKRVLVVAAEIMSTVVRKDGTHPQIAVLFGDGAGAALVSGQPGIASLDDAVLHSDGGFAGALQLGFDTPMTMDGRTVIMQAARKLPQVIDEVLERNGVTHDAVGTYLLHQANQNLTREVARALRLPDDRFFSNIQKYGNTSSASVLIALDEWTRGGGFSPGVPAVAAAFGAGLQWGAVLMTGR